MRYYSTRTKDKNYSFKEALYCGLAPDGGLFLPESLPILLSNPDELSEMSLHEIALHFLKPIVTDIEDADFKKIVERTYNFEVGIHTLNKNISVCELYHGPTLAFKDFGARFLAGVMSHFLHEEGRKCKILVATSGDTGSAVANGFLNVEGVEVVLLYPSGKVSKIQEQQLTTLGNNITALEVQGNFDDCQKLVKMAFADEKLREQVNLSSANSISIARLLPQAVYYIYSFLKLYKDYPSISFVVPSGNLGNITAGLLAKFAGLPVKRLYSALNHNDSFAKYLEEGIFIPQATIQTLSNAMDVGNPSNIERITSLFNGDISAIKEIISAKRFSDEQTMQKIKEVFEEFNYLIDPHTSIGMLYADLLKATKPNEHFVVMSTAHPAKFYEDVKTAIGLDFAIPDRLSDCLTKKKVSKVIGTSYEEFRELVRS